EMVKNGVTNDQLKTIQGRGKANSITGNKCDSVKGRKNLISCLAPDRRVEVIVNGVEVVTQPAK
ncbi:MAG: hypothetical protein K6F05_02065, partial [Succinivibrio sp.]|nr:hypothetical protein [Succinivibrio sp.]